MLLLPEPAIQDLLTALLPLVLIVQHGRTEAARRLGMGLPALDQRIKKLEIIFEVERGGIISQGQQHQLSEIGRRLIKLYANLKPLIDALPGHVDEIKNPKSLLRVGVPHSMWETVKTYMTEEYKKLAPNGSLENVSKLNEDIQPFLLRGDVDVAIDYEPEMIDSSLEVYKWYKEPFALVLNKMRAAATKLSSPEAGVKPSEIRILMKSQHKFFMMQERGRMHRLVHKYLIDNNIRIEEERIERLSSSQDAEIKCGQDQGVSILPTYALQLTNAGFLKLAKSLSRTIVIMYPKRSSKKPSIDILLRCAKGFKPQKSDRLS